MIALSKVQARGQVTLPTAIRRAAGIKPGDTVLFEVRGDGKVELEVFALPRLAELLSRYTIDAPVDDATDRERWQDEAAAEVLGAAHE